MTTQQQPWPQQSWPQPDSYRGPARTAHGTLYWASVGWIWGPTKWVGRTCLWVVFFPLGVWRSHVHGRKAKESRERRGYR